MIKINKNSDMLEAFASLNNHEIFTPPDLARKMLDLLPKEVWINPQFKFLDPTTKTGIFLREIIFRLFNGLKNKGKIIGYDGLEYNLNDNQERMNHILKNMVFGIATSELTGYMARRTIYGVMDATSNKGTRITRNNMYYFLKDIKSQYNSEKSYNQTEFNDYYNNNLFKNDINYKGYEKEGNIFYPHKEVDKLKETFKKEGKEILGIEDTFFPFIQDNIEHKKIKEIKEGKMKFDVIIGNPPYLGKSATHQKMFNVGVNLLKKDGIICFLQPASTYFNKKKFSKSAEQEMYDYIKKYKTYVYILPPSIFKGANISTDISITLLKKIKYNFNKVEFIKYKNGKIYKNVNLEDLTMTEINPMIYHNIKNKYLKLIEKNGSLYDISIKDEKSSQNAASIALIRGHRNEEGLKSDYFTFLSKNNILKKNGTKHGILCKKGEEESIHNYLQTKFARFSLTFLKFNTNNHMGELRNVPIVNWKQKWSDYELFKLINLTEEEKIIINNYIPYWNHYGK